MYAKNRQRKSMSRGLAGLFAAAAAACLNPAGARAADYETAEVVDGGQISGQVLLHGSRPQVERFIITKNNTVCGPGTRDVDVVKANGSALQGALVILKGVKRGKPFRAAARKVTINQAGCRFEPGLAVFANNGVLEVINSDNVLHNVHVFSLHAGKRTSVLNVSQPVRGDITVKTISLKKGGPLLVTCDAHNFMRGHAYVAETPYYAKVDRRGRFTIGDIPPGTYELVTWHPALGSLRRQIVVKPDSKMEVTFEY